MQDVPSLRWRGREAWLQNNPNLGQTIRRVISDPALLPGGATLRASLILCLWALPILGRTPLSLSTLDSRCTGFFRKMLHTSGAEAATKHPKRNLAQVSHQFCQERNFFFNINFFQNLLKIFRKKNLFFKLNGERYFLIISFYSCRPE